MMKSKEEFIQGVINFMENYIDNGRRIDCELLKELKELSDFAKNTRLYKNQKDKADFYNYSYDDIFNHMCIKIKQAPILAVHCAVLCIPFIYDKCTQEGGM